MVIYRRRNPLPEKSEAKQKIDPVEEQEATKEAWNTLVELFSGFDPHVLFNILFICIMIATAALLVKSVSKQLETTIEESSESVTVEAEVSEKDAIKEEDPEYRIIEEVTVDKEQPDVCFLSESESLFFLPDYEYDIYLDGELIADDVTSSWPAYELCTEVEEGKTGTFDLTVEVFEVGEDEPLDEYDMKLTVNKENK